MAKAHQRSMMSYSFRNLLSHVHTLLLTRQQQMRPPLAPSFPPAILHHAIHAWTSCCAIGPCVTIWPCPHTRHLKERVRYLQRMCNAGSTAAAGTVQRVLLQGGTEGGALEAAQAVLDPQGPTPPGPATPAEGEAPPEPAPSPTPDMAPPAAEAVVEPIEGEQGITDGE